MKTKPPMRKWVIFDRIDFKMRIWDSIDNYGESL